MHPLSIGIHNCQRNDTAGVICPQVAYSTTSDTIITTSESLVFTVGITIPSVQVCIKGRGIKGILAYYIVLLLQQTSALSAIIGVVGGVLGIGAGMAIATVFAVVLWTRKRIKRGRYTDTYMDPVMHQTTACTYLAP